MGQHTEIKQSKFLQKLNILKKNSYDAKIYGVIEGPVNQMLKFYQLNSNS